MKPVQGPKRSDDSQLFEEVCARLLDADELSPCDISVRVRDRVVHLSGWVRTPEAKRLALEITVMIPGVMAILDQIQVRMLTNSFDRSHNAGN